VPTRFTEHSPFQNGGYDIVAVFKDVRFNNEIFADNAFDRIAPAVDQRLQVLNDCGRKRPKHGRSIKPISAAAKGQIAPSWRARA
jgi:hypothetical protein